MLQTESSSKRSFLQKAIFANAVFSGVSGALFLAFSSGVAAFLGDVQALYITIVGGVLLMYALFLYFTAKNDRINKWLVWAIIDLDILWVVGSAVLVFTNLLSLTTAGKWGIAIIADVIAVFAILQYIGLGKASAK